MTIDHQNGGQAIWPQRARDCALPLTDAVCSHLVSQHGPMVKAACHRILGDATLAEDAAQEVFLLLVRKLPSLPPRTVLGGWLYVTACHVAQTHQRTQARRRQREKQPEATENLMNPAQDSLWRELEPLLDHAMLTLSRRQRELVVLRYFQNNTQRAAAAATGCSESVASRELAKAIEELRGFFARHGVSVSGMALITLLTEQGAEAFIGTATFAATLSSASAATGMSAAASFFMTMMKTSATAKIITSAGLVLIAVGTIHHLARRSASTTQSGGGEHPNSPLANADASASSGTASAPNDSVPRSARALLVSGKAMVRPRYDEGALQTAREREAAFWRRMGEFALMGDGLKVQKLLLSEYGIQLSMEEIGRLQEGGQKRFATGIVELWPSKQPREALAWAASVFSGPIGPGTDLHQRLLNGARTAMPGWDRDTLTTILPEGPGKAKILDLMEAATNPQSLANRILAETDAAERASRLKLLAQGWADSETSAAWAREHLTGRDKTTFYAQVGYNLAEQKPNAALQVLAELQDTDAYVSTFRAMMRGLVQEGGQGPEVAELIASSNLEGTERAQLISDLAGRWVRRDADAAVMWANSLAAPEDFRAAIPLLVSQLDDGRVSRTVEGFLKHVDPLVERALIEAAAPRSLDFDPGRSRLILDPMITNDPALKLRAGEGSELNKEELLWDSVSRTAKREAEMGQPASAMEWLSTLPFASESDYARAISSVLVVWNLKSHAQAADWLHDSALNPALKSDLVKSLAP